MKSWTLQFILGSVFFLGCDTKDDEVTSFENEALESAMAKAMVSKNNQFALDFFQEISENETKENYMVSPLSLSMALGMVHNGADGDTKLAFDDLLGNDASLDERNQFNKDLRKSLTTRTDGTDLSLANAIWIQENFPVVEDFISTNQNFYDAEVGNLDFREPEAVTIVNDWVERKTNGKIEEIVEEFDPQTRLFLVNALYFKSEWKYRFKTEDTRNAPFYSTPENSVDVQMMNMNAEVPHFSNEMFSSIILPYKKERFEMLLFLPHSELTTNSIVESMTSENLNAWLEGYQLSDLDVGLPKFKMEYENTLNDELTNMGLGIAFSSGADFGKINKEAPLQISEVIQKTFIEVNEEGTEAAAVTGVGIELTSAGPSFVANRPFLYMIRDSYTGSICFMGRVGLP